MEWICPNCKTASTLEAYIVNLKVCPACNYPERLSWKDRLGITIDQGSFTEIDSHLGTLNPIGYPDYEDKIAGLQKLCNTTEAVVTGECCIQGYPVVIGVMDSRFLMASMGSVVGEKITRAFEYGVSHRLPVIIFCASGGARMHEGIISLMQMAKTSGAVLQHSRAGLLYIAVLTDPTTGGVTASFATQGDIVIAEPKSMIGFAGMRVIQDTIGAQGSGGSALPEGFQTAEFLFERGFLDMIVPRSAMRDTLARIMRLHGCTRKE